MCLAIAVSIPAQTIPLQLRSGTKKSNGKPLSAVAPFRENKFSEIGVFEHSYSSKNVVECDPNADDSGIGILCCGMNHYGIKSEASRLGGVCMDPSAGSHMENRDLLQVDTANCTSCELVDLVHPIYGFTVYNCYEFIFVQLYMEPFRRIIQDKTETDFFTRSRLN
jgi:hypothetical protein